MDHRHIFSVAELNADVSDLLRSGFPLLWVEGELSNFTRPASGHMYFSLKDSKAQLRCAMFKNRNMHLRFRPASGIQVLARGRVALYEPRGEFQFIVDHLEEAGEGRLQREFEALKHKLSAAGLFDTENKQPLPRYPERIGVITSATGAAIQDITHVLQRRAPHVEVLIYPVDVQGDKSAPQIVKAIRQACFDKYCDVLILSRGGGSLEDLWSFNDERVAHAIAAADIPIISGVGHEIDTTIADFVADVRAATPSVAAELAVVDSASLLAEIDSYQARLQLKMQQVLAFNQQRLKSLSLRLQQQRVDRRLEQYRQRIDELSLRQYQALVRQAESKQQKLQQLVLRLQHQSPQSQLEQQHIRLTRLHKSLHYYNQLALQQSASRLGELSGRLHAVSPLATLQRGYSIARKDGVALQSTASVKQGDEVQVLLAEGEMDCVVKAIR